MMPKIIANKQVRYVFYGGITALVNLAVIWIFLEVFDLDTPLERNLANLAAIEISVLVSFFVYRLGVWVDLPWSLGHVLCRQIPLYHLSMAATVLLRSLLLFPLFDWIGLQPLLNTLIGILVGATIGYFLNDIIVFAKKQ
jgi:dolichol-phosphate mannosyltransferase